MLLSNLDLLATAPGGVARLRELILTLAVQGKLVPQDPADEPAGELLKKIRAEKDRLIAEGKIKRDKTLLPITDEEKPFELPVGWEWVRLGATMEMFNGRPFKPTDWLNSGMPIVRIQNLNKLEASFNYCDPASVTEKNRIDDGSFLISWSGTPGTSFGAFIWRRGPAALNQHIFKCELLGEAFSPDFLKLSINSQLNVLIAKAQGGVGLQHVTKGVLENLVLVLPPLSEQSRIVTRVEGLMRLCDALEAKGRLEAAQHAQLVTTLLGALTASATPEALADNWQRVAQHFDLLLDRPAAIDALEQTLLQLAVRGLLVPQDPADEPASTLLARIHTEKDRLIAEGQIKRDKPLPPIADEEKPFALPVGWEWARLNDLIRISSGDGLTAAQMAPGGTVPVYGGNGVNGHHDQANVEEPTLAIGRVGYYCGSVHVTPARAWVTDNAFITRYPKAYLDMSWLYWLLVGTNLKENDSATAQPVISGRKLYPIVVALPPLPEQSRIVTRVTALRQLCSDLRQRLAERQSVQARLAEALVASVA